VLLLVIALGSAACAPQTAYEGPGTPAWTTPGNTVATGLHRRIKFWLPGRVAEAHPGIEVEPLPRERWERREATIVRAMDVFPPSLLQYIDTIYAVDRVYSNRVHVGGVATGDGIVFVGSSNRDGIMDTLVHEIGHEVWHRFGTAPLRDRWRATLPPSNPYLNVRGHVSIRDGLHSDDDYEYDEESFVSAYATVNIEEDFAETFEYLYDKPEWALAHVAEGTPIGDKVLIAMEVAERASAGALNDAYFTALAIDYCRTSFVTVGPIHRWCETNYHLPKRAGETP
jgi:hypothetical protein